MNENLGLGVMINMLGGNQETVESFQGVIGKKISEIEISENELKIGLEGGEKIRIFDDGQSCCESRYMSTDDDLKYYIGANLLDGELADGPNKEDEYGEAHEQQFLKITTSKGVFTIVNHNEHNGYYGGFSVVVRKMEGK